MEVLEKVRLDAYIKIYSITQNAKASTIIEHDVWSSVCKCGSLCGIPVWNYGADTVLFETDRPEIHFREAVNAYNDKLEEVFGILSLPKILKQIMNNVDTLGASLLHKIEIQDIEALTEYGSWRETNLESIKKAKSVLEEREETIDAFILCKKCKSNAVDTEQRQTRAADEPMTIFCVCRKCGSRWKIE